MEKEILELCRTAVTSTIKESLAGYLKNNLFGYNSPFNPLIKTAVDDLQSIKDLMKEAVDEVVQDPEFKKEFKVAIRKRLVNELVKSFSLEGTFKKIRNNPEAKQQLLASLEKMANG